MTFATTKDPESVEDFSINYAALMAESDPADTIATSSWTADSGVTVNSNTNSTTSATVWVSGGVRGTVANLVNTITTAGGRTHQRTIALTIADR